MLKKGGSDRLQWNADSQLVYDGWEEQKENILGNISEKIRTELTASTTDSTYPVRDIYGALEFAHNLVQPAMQQGSFSKYTLILLSSMEDTGRIPPDNMHLLGFNNVIVVAEECGAAHPCTTKDVWESRLQMFGVAPAFLAKSEVATAVTGNGLACEPNSIPSVSFDPNSTEYVMVLIDKTEKHAPYLSEAINLTTNIIANNMKTGDHLSVSWLDLSPMADETMFVDERVPPVPTPSHSELNLSATECEELRWKAIRRARHNEWELNKQIAVEEAAATIIDQMGTPEPSDGKLIYESLQLMSQSRSSLLLQDANEDFKRYTLFIFSNDLNVHEWRECTDRQVQNMDIHLNNMNVYLVDLSCDKHLSCDERNKEAIERIQCFGPSVAEAIIPITDDHIPNFLLKYMTEYHNE